MERLSVSERNELRDYWEAGSTEDARRSSFRNTSATLRSQSLRIGTTTSTQRRETKYRTRSMQRSHR